jgi:MFS family permease
LSQQEAVTSAMPPGDQPTLWRSRNFLLLWSGQSAGEVAAQVASVAVPILAAATLHASVFQVSLITFFTWLPYLFFSLPAGVLADRLDRRRLMIFCDVGRSIAMLSIPVASLGGFLTLPFLYVVVAVAGILTVQFSVAYKTQLPRLVRRDQLVDSNAKLTVSAEFAELIGPTISGLLIGLIGAAKVFLGNALAFLLSAVTLWLIRETAREPQEGEPQKARVPLRRRLTEGMSFIRREPILRAILAATAVSNFFVMASGAIEVIFMLRDLRATPFMIGLVFSISAVGGLLVGAAADRISRRIGSARIIWLAMAVPGPLYWLMPLGQPGWGVLVCGIGLAAFSAASVLFNVSSVSYRQLVTPPRLLGRVNASYLWISYSVIPLGALTGGLLGSQLGMRPALWICVLGTWSAALFVFFSPLRRMRYLPAVTH